MSSLVHGMAGGAGSDVQENIVTGAYFLAVGILWVYSFFRWKNLLKSIWTTKFFTDRPRDENKGCYKTDQEPKVTIQICTYNEGSLIEETIACACRIDWPKDRLTIQICDDSTDAHSIHVIEEAVAHWRAYEGMNIERLSRPDRIGYKAGNLRYHFDAIEGEYVAHFDADHQMEPDFLRNVMPFFFNEGGESKDKIGLVQAPWGYYNVQQNLLTECDAITLDLQHSVEQVARSSSYKVFGFNGTGGVWRKKAIHDVGGWSWESVTEDLALSYLTYLKGYEFVYVRDVPQLLELPSCIQAHIQQKTRWTKGFFQVFRLYYRDIFNSEDIPMIVKLEAFAFVTGPIRYACALIMLINFPLLPFRYVDTDFLHFVSLFPLFEALCSAIVAIYAKVPGGDEVYSSFFCRTWRLVYLIPYFSLQAGVVLFETKAILEGLLSRDATFLTTPKEGMLKSAEKKRGSANKVSSLCVDDVVALLGVVLALHWTMYIVTTEYFADWSLDLLVCSRLIIHLICTCGLLWVHIAFIANKYRLGLPLKSVLPSKTTRFGFLLMLSFLGICVHFGTTREYLLFGDVSSAKMNVINSASADIEQWGCQISSKRMKHSKQATPVVVFAMPRTGSNRLFELLGGIDKHSPKDEMDLLLLYEFFARQQSAGLSQLADHMSETCDNLLPNPNTTFPEATKTTKDGILKLKEEMPDLQPFFDDFYPSRFQNPIETIQTVSSLFWEARLPYFAFKIFLQHFDNFGLTKEKFIHQLQGRFRPVFVILWRRRAIESLVSNEIAMKSGNFLKTNTSGTHAVYLKKTQVQSYVERTKRYYRTVRSVLESLGANYVVLEYNRDLRTRQKQANTVTMIQQLLNVSHAASAESILQVENSVTKQAQVPLSEQVLNWQEIEDWGYGGDVDEWEDIFPGK